MAAKNSPSRPAAKQAPVAAKKETAPAVSAVRNTAIPKAAAKSISHDMIARRAFEISQSPAGGSEIDNWTRAERELRGTK